MVAIAARKSTILIKTNTFIDKRQNDVSNGPPMHCTVGYTWINQRVNFKAVYHSHFSHIYIFHVQYTYMTPIPT